MAGEEAPKGVEKRPSGGNCQINSLGRFLKPVYGVSGGTEERCG